MEKGGASAGWSASGGRSGAISREEGKEELWIVLPKSIPFAMRSGALVVLATEGVVAVAEVVVAAAARGAEQRGERELELMGRVGEGAEREGGSKKAKSGGEEVDMFVVKLQRLGQGRASIVVEVRKHHGSLAGRREAGSGGDAEGGIETGAKASRKAGEGAVMLGKPAGVDSWKRGREEAAARGKVRERGTGVAGNMEA